MKKKSQNFCNKLYFVSLLHVVRWIYEFTLVKNTIGCCISFCMNLIEIARIEDTPSLVTFTWRNFCNLFPNLQFTYSYPVQIFTYLKNNNNNMLLYLKCLLKRCGAKFKNLQRKYSFYGNNFCLVQIDIIRYGDWESDGSKTFENGI